MIKNKEELKEEFSNLVKQYDLDDDLRDKIIILTRNITKFSKQAIYAIHRDELDEAKKLIVQAEDEMKRGSEIINESEIHLMNNFRGGIEEYIEAKAYLLYVTENKIPTRKELMFANKIPYETYMEALSDFTGELAKRSITLATANKIDEVKKIKETIDEVYGFYLEFDFRSSELRRKFEGLKYNLNKVESIIYDLTLKLKN